MKPDTGREQPDLTTSKKAEDARTLEKRFSNAIIDSILGVFYVLDVKGNFVRDNRYHQNVLGYSEEEILKMNALDTIAIEDRDLISAKIQEVFEKGFTIVSAHILTRDGRKIPFLFTGYPAEIEGNQYLIGMGIDISERVRAEEALKASENLYRAIFNNTGAATIIIARDTTIILANGGWEKLTGIPRDLQENRMKWPAFFEKDDAERMKQYHYARRKDPSLAPNKYECRLIDVQGEMHYCIAQVDMIPGTANSVASLVDITDRKRAEEALGDAKNQAELFLDLMGHDISNMNQIGVGYLELARENMTLDETTRELISKPLETLYDSSRLIADVNKLQRITTCEIKLAKTDVSRKLREVVDAYRDRPGIKTTIRYSEFRGCQAMANELLYDAFANIVWDSIKNAAGDNAIDISLAREVRDDQPRCIVTIESHGTGLSDELKIRLFERPRKGMKRTGGRGIGLYLAKSIIDRFGGTLSVEDLEPGDYTRGTRFIIMLPACE